MNPEKRKLEQKEQERQQKEEELVLGACVISQTYSVPLPEVEVILLITQHFIILLGSEVDKCKLMVEFINLTSVSTSQNVNDIWI